MIVVISWLVIIMLGFGLLTPSNATASFALLGAVLSVSGALFLIMELDRPFGGMIWISSQPMRNALSQIAE